MMRKLPAPLRDALLAAIIAACVGLAMAACADRDWARMIEAASLDQRFRWRGASPPSSGITIVLADDASLRALGRWPLSRHVLARAVRLLDTAGARLIAFDMLFPEADSSPPVGWRDALRTIAAAPPDATRLSALRTLADDDPDDDFAAALHSTARVLLPFALSSRSADTGTSDRTADLLGTSAYQRLDRSPTTPLFPFQPKSAVLPVEPLASAAMGLGHVTVTYDVDGRLRYTYLSLPYEGDFLPALPVRIAAAARKIEWSQVGLAPGAGITLGAATIPTDSAGRIVVNYRGPPGSFPTYSLVDLLNGRVPAAALQDRIVLLGASFTGNEDANPAPFGRVLMPGTEYLATIVDTLLSGDFIRWPPEWVAIALPAAVLFAAGLAAGLGSLLPTVAGGVVALTPAIGLVLASQLAFDRGWWLPTTGPLAALIAAGLGVILFRYFVVDGEGRRVKSAFRRYLAPALVSRIAANPALLRLGGERRDLTLMFCDIRGFSGVSEGFRDDPEGLTRLINRFLTPMTDIILERQGTIDKYMGDCIMAFWNAPLDDASHAAHACDSALAMFEALDRLNQELAAEGVAPLRIGIGLNSGSCVVGNMGSEQRFDYSVLGDAVNLASRLEGQSKTYGVGIVVGAQTRIDAPEHAMLEIDRIIVKGKAEAVSIFALLGDPAMALDANFRTLAPLHADLLAAYRGQAWDRAETLLARCRDIMPSLAGLYALYASRVAAFRAAPPPEDWDGVYVATSK